MSRSAASLVPGLCLMALLGGCHEPPQSVTATKLQPGRPTIDRSEYWSRISLPSDLSADTVQRVAPLEFVVEYVTNKVELPFATQFVADPPPVSAVQAGFLVTGIWRVRVDFEEDVYPQLADALYPLFTQALTSRGIQIIDPGEVQRCKAYRQLETVDHAKGRFAQLLNMGSSDTGSVKKMRVYPAEGFDVIVGPADKRPIAAIEREILDELNADATVRVRIRVGVYADKASVERNSSIWVTSRKHAGVIRATRSLVSSEPVISKQAYVPVVGTVRNVVSDKYLAALRTIFPPFLDMAFDAPTILRQ